MGIKVLFGKKIKEKRLMLQYTQEELAEKIGISAKSLSQIELGNNFVSAENLEAICGALNTSPKNLFDFSDNESKVSLKDTMDKLQKNKLLFEKVTKIIEILE